MALFILNFAYSDGKVTTMWYYFLGYQTTNYIQIVVVVVVVYVFTSSALKYTVYYTCHGEIKYQCSALRELCKSTLQNLHGIYHVYNILQHL